MTSDLRKNGFFSDFHTQIEKIKNNLKETDNPVLLIGIPKKDLHILN